MIEKSVYKKIMDIKREAPYGTSQEGDENLINPFGVVIYKCRKY